MYLNALNLVPEPNAVIAVTLTYPGVVFDGVVALAWKGDKIITPVAFKFPNLKVMPVAKFVPVINTEVPPAILPVSGDTIEMVGNKELFGEPYVLKSPVLPPAGGVPSISTELPVVNPL